MKKKKIILLLAVLILYPVFTQDGEEIIRRADSSLTGDNMYGVSHMRIIRGGEELPLQTMESYSMEINGEYHSLTVYQSPRRMKGTAYLMIEDDLWVRFASTGRIRKLSSSAKKNSAGGSDFSYADMGEGSDGIAGKYQPVLKGTEEAEGISCHVIELLPRPGEDVPYDKIVAFVSREGNRYVKLDHYEAGAHVKTMFLRDYRTVDGREYPYEIEMRNNTKDSVTLIETEVLDFDSSRVKKRMFSTSYLETIQ